jgi:rhodanese-related sulfurtransferase
VPDAAEPRWEYSPREVKALLERRPTPVLLVDCREPSEHATARIDGAVLVPLGELAARAPEVDRLADDRQVIVHCHHGVRSLKAAAILRRAGLDDAASMAGGIDAWSIQIDPSVPRY